jgi:hypothetical protein
MVRNWTLPGVLEHVTLRSAMSRGVLMIDSVSGASGIPQLVALVILAVGFVTILAWSIRSKSHKKS